MSAQGAGTHRTASWRLAVILGGLLVLLLAPALVWQRSEAYRRRADDEVQPANEHIWDAISTANEARSTAFYYLFTLDSDYAHHYQSLRTRWQSVTADDGPVARVSPDAVRHWRTGKEALSRWFLQYGNAYVGTGEQSELDASDRLFRRGGAELRWAGDDASQVASSLQARAASINRLELVITGLMALTCLVIAVLAWQDAVTRRDLWRSEQEASARLRLAVVETNHRVKNNLQTVASLLDMRLMSHQESVPVRELHDIVRQIQAVASVHDFLSHELTSDVVAGGPMLDRLVQLVARPAGLDAELEADQCLLSVKQATAVALITTELLLNAGKHGATSARVHLDAAADAARLSVADNGPGFGPGFEAADQGTMGLALVRTLAERDLAGDVEFRNEHGAVIEVRFPSAPPAQVVA